MPFCGMRAPSLVAQISAAQRAAAHELQRAKDEAQEAEAKAESARSSLAEVCEQLAMPRAYHAVMPCTVLKCTCCAACKSFIGQSQMRA